MNRAHSAPCNNMRLTTFAAALSRPASLPSPVASKQCIFCVLLTSFYRLAKFCLPKSLFALLVPRNEIFSFCFSHLLVAAVVAYRRIIFRFHFSYGFESEKLYQQWHTRACERVVVVGCSGSQVEGSFTYALHTHIIYAHIFLLLYNDMHKNSYRRSLQ